MAMEVSSAFVKPDSPWVIGVLGLLVPVHPCTWMN
jgi:hypothetical protein